MLRFSCAGLRVRGGSEVETGLGGRALMRIPICTIALSEPALSCRGVNNAGGMGISSLLAEVTVLQEMRLSEAWVG